MNAVPLVKRPTWIEHTALEARRFDPLYYDPSLTIAERLYKSNGALAWKRLHEVTTDIYSFGAYELTNRIRFVEPGPNTVPFINVTEIGIFMSISAKLVILTWIRINYFTSPSAFQVQFS